MYSVRQKFEAVLHLAVFTALVCGYSPVYAETTDTGDEHQHEQTTFEWPGVYQGFMPCADCFGIKTTLALNSNGTYITLTQFAGKSEREFVEKGRFNWSHQSNIVVLTPKNGATSQQYLVGDNQLLQLDKDGNRYTGKLADRYILRRNNVTAKAPSHGH
jgi:uncharacterized lipoprotein NlpE involved in copper resistance